MQRPHEGPKMNDFLPIRQLKGAGHYALMDYPTRRGEGKVRQLMEKLLEEIIMEYARYFRLTEKEHSEEQDHLFYYTERGLVSVILPFLHEKARFVMAEQPMERGKGKTEGRVDYWVQNHGEEYFIEAKFAYRRLDRIEVQSYLKKAWNSYSKEGRAKGVVTQAHTVNREKAEELSLGGRRWFRIAMLVIPLYKRLQDPEELDLQPEEDPQEHLRLLTETLNPKPNWAGIWFLPRKMQGPFANHPEWEWYSAILFICELSEISD